MTTQTQNPAPAKAKAKKTGRKTSTSKAKTASTKAGNNTPTKNLPVSTPEPQSTEGDRKPSTLVEFDQTYRTFAKQVITYGRRTGESAWNLGRLLEKIQLELPHGEYKPFLADRKIAKNTAQRWRK